MSASQMDPSASLPMLGALYMWMPILLSSLFLISSSWSKHRRIRKLGTYAPTVTHWMPFGLDIIGKIVQRFVTFRFIEWTQEILQVPGHTVEWQTLGVRLVITDEPENFKAIMSTKFSEFEKGDVFHKTFYSVLGDSVFATDGQLWQASKNQLRPFLSKGRPTDLQVTEEHVTLLIQHLRHPGETEVYNLLDRFQLDVATHIFCGESANSLQIDRQQLRNAVDALLRFNSIRVVFGGFGLLLPDTLFLRGATRKLNEYMKSHVAKALLLAKADTEKSENDLTLMKALAARSDPKEIRNQLVAVILAGKDPVAITLSWAIYELARHPEVVKKVQQEIRDVVGSDSVPDAHHLKNMRYLKNVIRETLRLYHPIGFNLRQARHDTTLPVGGGADGKEPVTVLKGASVLYSTIGLHRRRDLVGDDADEWKPERWEAWMPDMWEFIPFNHGPRICLGQAFGYLQMQYTIVRILQEFESIEYCGREQQIKIEMNTKMAHPVLCRFHKA